MPRYKLDSRSSAEAGPVDLSTESIDGALARALAESSIENPLDVVLGERLLLPLDDKRMIAARVIRLTGVSEFYDDVAQKGRAVTDYDLAELSENQPNDTLRRFRIRIVTKSKGPPKCILYELVNSDEPFEYTPDHNEDVELVDRSGKAIGVFAVKKGGDRELWEERSSFSLQEGDSAAFTQDDEELQCWKLSRRTSRKGQRFTQVARQEVHPYDDYVTTFVGREIALSSIERIDSPKPSPERAPKNPDTQTERKTTEPPGVTNAMDIWKKLTGG